MKSIPATFILALTTAAGIAHASGNPFALSQLAQGYQVAAAEKTQDGKCGEGKCGARKDAKVEDGKDTATRTIKARDGKCGEGKCGSRK
ncbi:MAG: hypothetical protein GC183_12810 [Thiobacillus sp.]|nr:hypothetical protein [Thiobacillus sp.]